MKGEDMRYRHSAFLALAVVAAQSVLAADQEAAAIMAVRAESNAGLLAHDVDRVLKNTTNDFILFGGTSGPHVGKTVVRDYYLKGFADPDLITYVRTPDNITISETNDRASERGKWQGVWRSAKSGSLMGGEYFAHWVKKDGAWVTLVEVYVTLRCSGPVCAP
jgi:hypothetical protein